MAQLICLTIGLSLALALLFFMPLLRVAGPEGHQGHLPTLWRAARAAVCPSGGC